MMALTWRSRSNANVDRQHVLMTLHKRDVTDDVTITAHVSNVLYVLWFADHVDGYLPRRPLRWKFCAICTKERLSDYHFMQMRPISSCGRLLRCFYVCRLLYFVVWNVMKQRRLVLNQIANSVYLTHIYINIRNHMTPCLFWYSVTWTFIFKVK